MAKHSIGERIVLEEDIEAIVVESGEEITLPSGSAVTVTGIPGTVIHYVVKTDDGEEVSIDAIDLGDEEAYEE